MRKNGLTITVFVVLILLWSMLAWGIDGVLSWLSVQATNGALQGAALQEGALLLVPQSVLDFWLPWLQAVWNWLNTFTPGVIHWLSYLIWIFWGLGAALLLVLMIAWSRLINVARLKLMSHMPAPDNK